MTPEQFAEFLNYVKENNSWGEKMYEVCCKRNRVAYKYVEATWDSRNNRVWSITLRAGGSPEGETFSVTTPAEIEALYKYLDNAIRPIEV